MMNDSFDVMTEPWIPVLDMSGQPTHVGLRDAVVRAHEFSEVSDGSPLTEYGLYRLLVTLVTDVFRPVDVEEQEDLLDEGRFDAFSFDGYVQKCRKDGVSFDLFDEATPFLQVPYCAEWDRELKPISTLDYTLPHGNNHVHFDHRDVKMLRLTYAEAARLLPAAQLFCTAGAQGYPSGVNGAPPFFAVARGQTLFETLVLSMVPTNYIEHFDDVAPWWRADILVEPKKTVPQTSWLFGMLFPARRIRLIRSDGEISQLYFSQGMNFRSTELWRDPHVAYRVSDDGRFALMPDTSMHPIWLNLVHLLRKHERPQIIDIAKKMDNRYADLQLYGVQTDKARYIDNARYDIRLPLEIADNDLALGVLAEALASAKDLANALFASLAIPEKPWTGGSGKRKIKPLPHARSAVAEYYQVSETDLWELVAALGESKGRSELSAAYGSWIEHIVRNALAAYSAAVEENRMRMTELQQIFDRQTILLSKIGSLRKTIKQSTSQGETSGKEK